MSYTMTPPQAGAGVEFVRGSKHCVPSLRYATGTRLSALVTCACCFPRPHDRRCIPQRLTPRPLDEAKGERGARLKSCGAWAVPHWILRRHCPPDPLEEGFKERWLVVAVAGGGGRQIGAFGAVMGSAFVSKGLSVLAIVACAPRLRC